MTTPPDTTILASKSAFIQTQIRLLARPLSLPPGFTEQTNLPPKVLDQVLRATNRQLARHNKTVYDALAVRSIAEQLDTLYWQATTTPADSGQHEDDGQGTDDVLRRDDDLTQPEVIAQLDVDMVETEEFAGLLERLRRLDERREVVRRRKEKFVRLRSELEFLREGTVVQRSLVTRDGKLAEQVDRARVLGVRIATRLAASRKRGVRGKRDAEEAATAAVVDERAKLKRTLDDI